MSPRPSNSDLPRGFSFAATACGLKKSGLDLGLLVSETPAAAAASNYVLGTAIVPNCISAAAAVVGRA